MNWTPIEADWKRFKHAAKRRWDRLGEQQLNAIAGRRHLLALRIREVYGTSEADTERELAEWQTLLGQGPA